MTPITPAPALLQIAAFDGEQARLQRQPFAFFVTEGVLADTDRKRLDADFPGYPSAGFFPHDPLDCGPR